FLRLCRVMQEHLVSLVAYGQHCTLLRAYQLEPTSNGASPNMNQLANYMNQRNHGIEGIMVSN
ncbi:MAG: hypothetical protein ACPGN8_06915, partial [Candidatus Thalassarchaeaceae archaeon]